MSGCQCCQCCDSGKIVVPAYSSIDPKGDRTCLNCKDDLIICSCIWAAIRDLQKSFTCFKQDKDSFLNLIERIEKLERYF